MQPRPLVLLADDDADTREMYQLVLSLNGFAVELARDGQEAWEKAQQLVPSVVVTDISLPRIDGFDLRRMIRAGSGTAHILVIAVTGWAGQGPGEKLREAGFDALLLKPVLPDDLVDEIRRVMRAIA